MPTFKAMLQTPGDRVISDYSLPALSGLEALRWVQESGAAWGWHTMAYRARVVGGGLDIASQSEGGTISTCSLPMTARETAR